MPILNQNVASTFEELADFLEIDGANPFRIRAYRNAARTIGDLSEELSAILERGDDLTGVEGIGKDLAAKIEEILRTGTLEALQEIQERIPASLGELLRLSGLGPKRVKFFSRNSGSNRWTIWRPRRGREVCGICPGWARRPKRNS